ncbi:MAG: DUF1788 domain-containing protein [Cyanobacteria bacterium MAG CAR1_bin_15]|nr:DUF1788 domain-containing protein [Cyanobacteria bacterium MAG CAR1_bin_15]
MSPINKLADHYGEHIRVPWQHGLPAANRVVILVYEKELERTLRGKLGEFEQRTRDAGHGWQLCDLTAAFALWMNDMDPSYREAYFKNPEYLPRIDTPFLGFVARMVREHLTTLGENDVVALLGAGSLFGFVRLSDVIREVDSAIQGRLVVFFPGQRDGSNYRLLDARDGWNYRAVAITCHSTGAVA